MTDPKTYKLKSQQTVPCKTCLSHVLVPTAPPWPAEVDVRCGDCEFRRKNFHLYRGYLPRSYR